jgi:hypothetical protein
VVAGIGIAVAVLGGAVTLLLDWNAASQGSAAPAGAEQEWILRRSQQSDVEST